MLRSITRSIGGKFLLVAMISVFTALAVSSASLIIYDQRTYRQSRVKEMRALADILAAANGPALSFNDPRAAQESMRLLRVQSSILAGVVYDEHGVPFASYAPEHLDHEVIGSFGDNSYRITGDRIVMSEPVVENGDRVGTLYLVGVYAAVQRFIDHAIIVGAVVLLSMIIAMALSLWLQRTLTRPILSVAESARRVLQHRDFSTRVEKRSEDEVGYLVDTFNAMLAEVGNRAAALEESEERFRVLADHAPVLVWLQGPEGTVFVNREYLRFVGRCLEEVSGMGWTTLIHPDDLDGYVFAYRSAVAERKPFEAQVRMRRADGVYRWFQCIGVPRFLADGTLANYVGCSFDITDIKEYIAELDRAERELREADRRKDQFLAVLSHELRNPLNPIRNAVSVLRMTGSEDPNVRWAMEVIDRQARQLTRLLDDLLDAARITRNKLELRLQRVDVATVVEMATETTRQLFDDNQQHLEVNLPVRPVYLKADAGRLAQVLGNILNNAAKYTDRGGRISLTARESNGELTISVKDSGIGIPPHQLSSVFEMFNQIPGNVDRAGGGLGIGLALVRLLVDLHGGRVEARSEGPGCGSEFIITLPTATAPEAAEESKERSIAATALGGLRVLVADDSQDSVESLAMLLRISHHEVAVASNGTGALETAAHFRPDVAILDIGMPDVSGYEVAERIRAESWGRDICLIALTGWGQQNDRSHALESGFDHHITKPADMAELSALLASIAARRAQETVQQASGA